MDVHQLTNIKLEITGNDHYFNIKCLNKSTLKINSWVYFLVYNDPLQISKDLSDFSNVPIDNMGLDKVFVINLARRTERRSRMFYCLNELGLNATFIEATDGRLVFLFYKHLYKTILAIILKGKIYKLNNITKNK